MSNIGGPTLLTWIVSSTTGMHGPLLSRGRNSANPFVRTKYKIIRTSRSSGRGYPPDKWLKIILLCTIFITKQKSFCHKTLLFMACPIVPKSSFSETKRSTRLLLNSSDVYKSPAEQVDSSMAPSDHIRTITNIN